MKYLGKYKILIATTVMWKKDIRLEYEGVFINNCTYVLKLCSFYNIKILFSTE